MQLQQMTTSQAVCIVGKGQVLRISKILKAQCKTLFKEQWTICPIKGS